MEDDGDLDLMSTLGELYLARVDSDANAEGQPWGPGIWGSGAAAAEGLGRGASGTREPSGAAAAAARATASRWARHGVPRPVVDRLWSTDSDVLEALIEFRDALSCMEDCLPARNAVVQSVIDTGAVPQLVELLKRDDNRAVQFEATWVLIHMVTEVKGQTGVLLDNGVMPVLARLLLSSDAGVAENAAWALGNLACEPAARDVALENGIMVPLLELLERTGSPTAPRLGSALASTGAWALANLCRAGGRVALRVDDALRAVRAIKALVIASPSSSQDDDNDKMLQRACWALESLTDSRCKPDLYGDAIGEVFAVAGLCPWLVALLGHPLPAVHTSALATVRNLLDWDDEYTQVIIDLHVLPLLLALLQSADPSIRQRACHALGHITSGTHGQIQAVIDAGIIPFLVQLMAPAAAAPSLRVLHRGVQKQAARAASDAVLEGTREQVAYLVRGANCAPALWGVLQHTEDHLPTFHKALQALERMLEVCGRGGDKDLPLTVSSGDGAGSTKTHSLRQAVLEKRASLARQTPCMELGGDYGAAPAAGP